MNIHTSQSGNVTFKWKGFHQDLQDVFLLDSQTVLKEIPVLCQFSWPLLVKNYFTIIIVGMIHLITSTRYQVSGTRPGTRIQYQVVVVVVVDY